MDSLKEKNSKFNVEHQIPCLYLIINLFVQVNLVTIPMSLFTSFFGSKKNVISDAHIVYLLENPTSIKSFLGPALACVKDILNLIQNSKAHVSKDQMMPMKPTP